MSYRKQKPCKRCGKEFTAFNSQQFRCRDCYVNEAWSPEKKKKAAEAKANPGRKYAEFSRPLENGWLMKKPAESSAQ